MFGLFKNTALVDENYRLSRAAQRQGMEIRQLQEQLTQEKHLASLRDDTVEDLKIVIDDLRKKLESANAATQNETTIANELAVAVASLSSQTTELRKDIFEAVSEYKPSGLRVMSNRKMQAELDQAAQALLKIRTILDESIEDSHKLDAKESS
jgi:CO dehydrogenase/acetyl-CoA synthase alpha subunit